MHEPTLAVAIGLCAVFAFLGAFVAAGEAARRYHERFARDVSRRLERGFVFVARGRALALAIGLVVFAFAVVLAASANPVIAVAAAIAAAAMPRIAVAWLMSRRRELFRQQLPDVLIMLAGGLRAGNGLSLMFAQVATQVPAPAGQEFTLMQREQRMGATLDRALAGLERRMPVEETVLLAAALRLGHASGGGVAEALETLADATRRKLAIEGRVRALTAQGRLQAWVMAALPFALLGLLMVVEPSSAAALTGTWPGRLTCLAVLVWQVIGLVFIRRVVAVEI